MAIMEATTRNTGTDSDFVIIDYLRLKGASYDRKNPDSLIQNALNGRVEEVKKLLNSGSSPNIINNMGETPLHLAILGGHNEVAHALIDDPKTNVNLADKTGYTPLHLAIRARNNELAKALINHKEIDVNLASGGDSLYGAGDSPLILAINHANTELIGALIKHKDILPDNQDKKLNTALHYGIKNYYFKNSYDEVLGYEPKKISAVLNTQEFLELINHEKTDINKADRNGDTPIHLVIKALIINQEKEEDEFKKDVTLGLRQLALDIINNPEFNSQITPNNDGITPLTLAQTLKKEDNHSLLDHLIELDLINDDVIPSQFLCKLGFTLMTDPVKIRQEQKGDRFYERKAIQRWINAVGGGSNPAIPSQKISGEDLEPLPQLKIDIDNFIQTKTTECTDELIGLIHFGNPHKIMIEKFKIFFKNDSEIMEKFSEKSSEIIGMREVQNPPTTTPAATTLGTQPQTPPLRERD